MSRQAILANPQVAPLVEVPSRAGLAAIVAMVLLLMLAFVASVVGVSRGTSLGAEIQYPRAMATRGYVPPPRPNPAPRPS